MDDLDLLHALNHAQGTYRRLFHRIAMDDAELKDKEMLGCGRMLHTLIREGDLTQKELAERLEVRPQSLTSALDRLEKAGFVERTRDAQDRRVQVVHLTPAGREMGELLHSLRRRAAEQYFSCLVPAEKEALSRLLEKIQQASHD
jgi:DNA-binding MarR family transcriptional regulator